MFGHHVKFYQLYLLIFSSNEIMSYPGMKISDISVDISPIYPISVMSNTISAMTDISVLNRYIVEISGLWHTRALV